MELFAEGLRSPIESRDRCILLLGQRGMGKTALLLKFEDMAKERGFVVARVSHNEDILNEIIELVQLKGSQYVQDKKSPVKGFSAGALGFSFGLTFTEEAQRSYGFRVKLGMLCEKLEDHGMGVLILVDEAKTSEKMRQLATTYQSLVGDGRNVAICMAGLPHAVSGILNDSVLTFLNRARKVKLGPISTQEIRAYYDVAFKELGLECAEDVLDDAAQAASGFPYLMQLIGYYAELYGKPSGAVSNTTLKKAIKGARRLGGQRIRPYPRPVVRQGQAASACDGTRRRRQQSVGHYQKDGCNRFLVPTLSRPHDRHRNR